MTDMHARQTRYNTHVQYIDRACCQPQKGLGAKTGSLTVTRNMTLNLTRRPFVQKILRPTKSVQLWHGGVQPSSKFRVVPPKPRCSASFSYSSSTVNTIFTLLKLLQLFNKTQLQFSTNSSLCFRRCITTENLNSHNFIFTYHRFSLSDLVCIRRALTLFGNLQNRQTSVSFPTINVRGLFLF